MTGRPPKEQMLAACLRGRRTPTRPAPASVSRWPDRNGHDPRDPMHQIGLQAGSPSGHAPITAYAQHNLTGAAGRQGVSPPAQRGTARG